MKELDSTARKLLGYAKKEWKALAVAMVFFVLGGALEPAIPALFKKLIDSGFKDGLDYPLWLVPVVIIGLFLLRGVMSYCGTYIVQMVVGRTILNIRLELMNALLRARSDLFIKLTPGQLVNKIIHDPGGASQLLGNTLIGLVKDAVVLSCLTVYLLFLNWQLTLIAFIGMPLLALAVRYAQKRLDRVGQSQYESQQKLTNIVDDNARAWRVIRTFGAIDFEKNRFLNEAQKFKDLALKQISTGALITPITQLAAAIGVSAIVTLALYQAVDGASTVGEFVSFIMALLMTISPMRHLADVFQPVAGALISARGAFELLMVPGEVDNGRDNLNKCVGVIDFRDVTVQYSENPVSALSEVNLHISAGSTIALVGSSGAGKTTVVNCLLRFVNPIKGEILLDGIDTSKLSLTSLRQHFAVVSQEIVLFDGSVAENVAYASKAGIDRLRVRACLESANLWNHVNSLPKGIDNSVGVNGNLLSGGQRQRLAIARALYKNAGIWIFDEATSALDSESESVIQNHIDSLKNEKTIIIIAHRLSTVRYADLICVMSEGKIVEQGTHEELMLIQGKYAEMINMQLS